MLLTFLLTLLFFQDWEVDGYLLHSLLRFHSFFHTFSHSINCPVCSKDRLDHEEYCYGPQVLALLSDAEFPFSIMLLLLNVTDFWPGLQDPRWPPAEGELSEFHDMCKYNVLIFVLLHCLSTSDLSFNSFLTCTICSTYFSSSAILLVSFFVSFSLLFSALADWNGSDHYVFFPFCLLPLQCCLLLGGCYLVFFLLMFLPCCCFNNVKSQVLAYSSWLLRTCFSSSIFLAAVLSLSSFGFLVLGIRWCRT